MEFSSNRKKILKMGLKSPFFVFFNSIFYIQMLIMWKYSFVYTNVEIWIYAYMWMWKTCGKLQKNVENSPKNVGNVWKCGKHVENLWKTHLYVQMCDFVANYTNVSQFFFIFYFLFFSCAGTWAGTYVYECSAVVLFNCMLLHVARNVREERAGVPVYLSIRNVCEHLYLIL